MFPENIYRITALILLLTAISISITFRRKAAKSGEVIISDAEGRVILTLRSIFGSLAWLSAFIYLINPGWMAWAQLPLPSWFRWTGAVIMVICLPFIYWVFSSLGNNVTHTVVTRGIHSLVTYGPYQWIRHPLYTVGFLTFTGYSILAANWFIFTMLTLGAIILMMRTSIEEQHLLVRFGDDYRQYISQTGRYLPKIRPARQFKETGD